MLRTIETVVLLLFAGKCGWKTQKDDRKTKEQTEWRLGDLEAEETQKAQNKAELSCYGPGTDSGWTERSLEPRDVIAIYSFPVPILQRVQSSVESVEVHLDQCLIFRENNHYDVMFSVMATSDGMQVAE